jgi:hypothetical protein
VNREVDLILKLGRSKKLKNIPIIIYADDADGKPDYPEDLILSKMLTYSELRSKLKTLLTA